MQVLVMGASRGIGLETVAALRRSGLEPIGFSRRIPADLKGAGRWIDGDATDAARVADAIRGVDVVIQTLGIAHSDLFKPVSLFSTATGILVDAMQRQGVRRVISVTGFGAGRSRAAIPFWQLAPFELLFGRAYKDKTLQEFLIVESDLDWTIVRPGVLTNGPQTGAAKVLTDPVTWRNGMVARKDVAAFLAAQVSDQALIQKDVVLVA